MNTRLKQALAGVLGAVVAMGLMQLARHALAAADESDATEQVPRVIPWEGTVALAGEPFDGPLAMRFTLYDDNNGAIWTETWDDATRRIPVVAGSFSVLLGTYQSIEGAIADAADLALGVEVKTTGSWTALAGRQRLAAAPYGLWASRSSSLVVANTLSVGGAATVTSNVLSSQDVTLGARLALGSGKVGPHGVRFGDSDAGAQLAYRTPVNSLQFEARNDLTDTTDQLKLDLATGAFANAGTTTIQGALTVAGGLDLTTGRDLILGPDTTPDAITGAVDEPWLRLGASTAAGATSLYFGSPTDAAGMSLSYYPANDAMYIESGLTGGSPAAAASRYMVIRPGQVEVAQDLDVAAGHASVSQISTNWIPDECLNDDSINKLFKADSGCVEGAIRIMTDSGPNPDLPGLCACFNGDSQNQKGERGWHCFM